MTDYYSWAGDILEHIKIHRNKRIHGVFYNRAKDVYVGSLFYGADVVVLPEQEFNTVELAWQAVKAAYISFHDDMIAKKLKEG